jgi:hypothetical protein
VSLTVKFIKQSIINGGYELSLHADEERLAEGLTIVEIENALQSLELLEDYPNDPRGRSCLVLGYAETQPVHVVCGLTKQQKLLIITVYLPCLPEWEDERTRSREER